jgi:hypothetical protein
MLRLSNKTTYQLGADAGIVGADIRRIVRGEKVEVSRLVLVLISLTMVLDKSRLDQVAEMANPLLEAGGYKQLRGR